MHRVMFQVVDFFYYSCTTRLRRPELHCVNFKSQCLFKVKKLRDEKINITLKDQHGDKFVPISTAKYELMCIDC